MQINKTSCPQYILRVERHPETQKLRTAGLFYPIHPLEVNAERGYYSVCVSFTECYAEEGVSQADKENGSYPGELVKLIEVSDGHGVCVCFSLWAFYKSGDQRHACYHFQQVVYLTATLEGT